MNPTDEEPDRLLRTAAGDTRPAQWAHTAARGLEARVLARLARKESWAEAAFGLASWRPLLASAGLVAIAAVWAGGSAAQVWDDEWLAGQTTEDESFPAPPGIEDIDY